MSAVDFAWSKPPPAVLKQYGITVVICYVGPPGWGKTITQAEFDAYINAGIAVVFVFEWGADDASGGSAAGADHARLALQWAPTDKGVAFAGITRPIYFAEDTDVVPATREAYWQGIDSVIPPALVGDYAEGDLNQLLHDAGYSSWHWLSGSTSYPGSSGPRPITNIWQKVGNPIPGYDTDPDDLLTLDVGQYPAPDPQPQPQQETEVSLDTIPPFAARKQPYRIPSNGSETDSVMITYDALAPGEVPTSVQVRLAVHTVAGEWQAADVPKIDGNWEVALPAGGTLWVPISPGFDGLSITNAHIGTDPNAVELTIRV